MKNAILVLGILLAGCEEKKSYRDEIPSMVQQNRQEPVKHHYKSVTMYKHVKDLKQSEETHTSYKYKYNIWKGNFYHQPNVQSETHYFVVWDNHTHSEVSQNEWLNYSIGDSVAFTTQELID